MNNNYDKWENWLIFGGKFPQLFEDILKVDLPIMPKTYLISIKNHSGNGYIPDYEDEVESLDIFQAAMKFHRRMPLEGRADWSPEDLIPYITEAN